MLGSMRTLLAFEIKVRDCSECLRAFKSNLEASLERWAGVSLDTTISLAFI
jgi:hypothetical protein